MSRLIWDATGEKNYEMGTKQAVLYPMGSTGTYENGVAWNGITAVTESPSGAEETKLYADDIKYASLRSAEDYGYTVEAYTYPPEWEACDGSAQVAKGVTIGQQKRKAFGFSWVTTMGNDVSDEAGQKIHIAWNSTASPSEKNYATINDSPDAVTFSWECTTSYNKIVVFIDRSPAECYNKFRMLWIGMHHLPQDGLRKAPTTASLFGC